MPIYYSLASNQLQFTQRLLLRTPSNTGNVWIGAAANFLQLNQKLTPNYYVQNVNQSILFNQTVRLFGGSIWNRSAFNLLNFSHDAKPRVYDCPVFQNLIFTQSVFRIHDATNTLYFYQVISVDKSKAISDLLIFNQAAVGNITRNVAFAQTINFQQSTSVTKVSATAITTPSAYTPVIPRAQNVTFTYSTFSLNIRPPDFDNTESPSFTRVTRLTRGGDLYVFRDIIWPKNTVLKYKWTQLKQSEAEALLQFIQDSLGQIITLVDYENNTWSAIINTPNSEISQIGRFLWSAELTMELG